MNPPTSSTAAQSPYTQLFAAVKTTDASLTLQHSLDQVIARLYTLHAGDLSHSIEELLPQPFAQVLVQIGNSQHVTWSDISQTQTYLRHVQDLLKKAPTITLTLAQEPSSETLRFLYRWVQTHGNPESLVTIETDPSLIGGAIIIADGRYKDLSVKKALSELFIRHETELLALLQQKP